MNRKQGYWIHYYSESQENVKKEEGYYLNDIKVGSWIFYYPDGESIKATGEYQGGDEKVPYMKYYNNGELKEQGVFYNNN